MDRSQQTHLLKLFHFGKLTDVVHSANTVAQTAIWVELLKRTKAKKIRQTVEDMLGKEWETFSEHAQTLSRFCRP